MAPEMRLILTSAKETFQLIPCTIHHLFGFSLLIASIENEMDDVAKFEVASVDFNKQCGGFVQGHSSFVK